MLDGVKDEAKRLRDGPPGRRFELRYERRRSAGRVNRGISIAVGAIITVVGLILVPLPGPGWLITLFGVGLLGGDSRSISRFLDRVELRFVRARARYWTPRPARQKRLLLGIGAVLGAAGLVVLGYSTYELRGQLPLV